MCAGSSGRPPPSRIFPKGADDGAVTLTIKAPRRMGPSSIEAGLNPHDRGLDKDRHKYRKPFFGSWVAFGARSSIEGPASPHPARSRASGPSCMHACPDAASRSWQAKPTRVVASKRIYATRVFESASIAIHFRAWFTAAGLPGSRWRTSSRSVCAPLERPAVPRATKPPPTRIQEP